MAASLLGAMHRLRPVVCLALALAAAPVGAAETQVPLDRAGRVQRVDASLARRIRMFTDRPQFQEARLFLLADSTYVLEISSSGTAGAGLSRERIPLLQAGVDSLRDVVTNGMATHKAPAKLDASGRPLFTAATTGMCLGFYGWAVPYVFEPNATSEVTTGTYLLTASAGTFIPLFVTRNRPVTMGTALMSWYGMSRGTIYGVLLPAAVSEDFTSQTQVATALGMSIGLGIAGFEWAARSGMSEGTAATIRNGLDFGSLYGLAFANLMDSDAKGHAAGTLSGAAGGLVLGSLYASRRDHTYGDAGVMSTTGWVGAYSGLALVQAFHADEYLKSSTVGSLVGATASLWLGDRLVRDKDFSFGQSVIVGLSALGGGLFGLGIASIASNGDVDQQPLFWSLSAVGSISGCTLGYVGSARSARRAAADRSGWQFELVPSPPARRGALPGVMMTVRTTLQ